jgi:cysteine-rich repeat protein
MRPSLAIRALLSSVWVMGCAVGQGNGADDHQATFGSSNTHGEESSGPSSGASEGGTTTSSSTTMEGTTQAEISSDGSSEGGIDESCGNGVLDPTEECDDGNEDLCDGCEDCRIRTSIFVDGISSLVEVDDVIGAPLALLSTPFTAEAWMRVDAMGDVVHVLRRGNGNTGWRVTMNENGLVGTVFSGFDHIVSDMPLVGTGWHHVAWTYDLAVSRLFLDGQLVGSMDFVAPVLEQDQPMRIGAWVDGDGTILAHARGRVDEVRISSIVRYANAFTPARRFDPDAATVLLMHFDEGSGMTPADASPMNHTPTATNLTWEPEDGYGVAGFCE